MDDQAPGFRIVMDRLLSKDWLYLVRKRMRQKGDLLVINTYLDDSENLIRELASNEAPELKVIGFYKLLNDASASGSQLSEQLTLIASVNDATGSDSAGDAAAKKLNSLLKSKPAERAAGKKAASAESDDQAYFRYVASRIGKN